MVDFFNQPMVDLFAVSCQNENTKLQRRIFMTLGTKLAIYRRLSGLTQQQLGERLNLSAQAISKWEKDLTEPDLSTLRTLAELYKVKIDDLLDPNGGFPDPAALAAEAGEETEEKEETAKPPIGFCKNCGITVTEENLGQTDPVILCQKCLKAQKDTEAREAAEKAREAAALKQKRALEKYKLKRHRVLALVVAGLVAAVFLGVMIATLVNDFSGGLLLFTVIGTYMVFSFIACLFFDCLVQDVVADWFSKSFNAPGLIFTFDIDGFLWMIGMKILFFFIGLAFGIVVGAIGIMIGLVCAPFVFPHTMKEIHNEITSLN